MRPLSQTKTRAFEKFMDMFKITQLTRGVLLAQRSLALDTVFSAEVLSSDGNGASLQWSLQVHGAPRLASYLAPGVATVHSQKIATAGRDRGITGQRFGGAPCPWSTQPARLGKSEFRHGRPSQEGEGRGRPLQRARIPAAALLFPLLCR